MRTLIIAGGSFDMEFAAAFLSENKYGYVIAVDGGLGYAVRLGIRPDMIIGDMDTHGTDGIEEYRQAGSKVIVLNPVKDDTDTESAIREAVALGKDMDILGATGGRIDHLLANIHNLKIALDAGLDARIIDRGNIIFLRDKSFTVSREDCPGRYISFVPFAGEVTGIQLKGFKYPLDGYTLKPGASRCVSNELTDGEGTVSFDDGEGRCLIVVNSSDVKSE